MSIGSSSILIVVTSLVISTLLIISQPSDDSIFQIYPRIGNVTPFHTHRVHMLYVSGLADYDHVRKLLIDEGCSKAQDISKCESELEFEPVKMNSPLLRSPSDHHDGKVYTPLVIGNVFYEESSADSYAELIPGVILQKRGSNESVQCTDELCVFKEMFFNRNLIAKVLKTYVTGANTHHIGRKYLCVDKYLRKMFYKRENINSVEHVELSIPISNSASQLDYQLNLNLKYDILSLLTSATHMVQSFGIKNVLKLGIQTALLGLPIQLPIMGVKGISEWREFDTRDPILIQNLVLTSPLFPIVKWKELQANSDNRLVFLEKGGDVSNYYLPFKFQPLAALDLKNAKFVMTPPFNVGTGNDKVETTEN
ncbi:hypothetical protein C9374_007324 [Naegleria lovaniensis]|uniref:Uncharacterized protein n=1 Tax=Naegleria lovaniensis TaxID=51637 RepID=A0AA88GLQ5_NAELO|nr:uncharacterized protein C9374_007324 [Naegleria lovaniensis]KAG2379185.1 hypothetical protein C9374_007324 [Naegleria lovaniensis]